MVPNAPLADLTKGCLAYTRYSFFEWALIFLDISYDSLATIDFKEANLQVFQFLIFFCGSL
jgi:hypothetical protein